MRAEGKARHGVDGLREELLVEETGRTREKDTAFLYITCAIKATAPSKVG